MVKKLCTFAGCNEIVDHPGDNTQPRCAKHKPKQKRKKYDHHFIDGVNIYKTPQWKAIRTERLRRNPLCQRCLIFNISKPAQMVDHIVEIEDGGEPFDIDNTQSLCNTCHNKKTGEEKRQRNKKKTKYLSFNDF